LKTLASTGTRSGAFGGGDFHGGGGFHGAIIAPETVEI
jgi:hypothetical protein